MNIFLYSSFSLISLYFHYIYNIADFANLSVDLETVLSFKIWGIRSGVEKKVKRLGIKFSVKLWDLLDLLPRFSALVQVLKILILILVNEKLTN